MPASADTSICHNGLVNVSGGDGNDTLRIIGTEFSDIFVITAEELSEPEERSIIRSENLELDGSW